MNRVVLLVLFSSVIYSAVAQERFNFRRSVQASDSGWHAVVVPADMFGQIQSDYRDLRLLRIVDSDTVEIPYFVRTLQAEERVETADIHTFNQSTRDGVLYVSFKNEPGRKINRVELHFKERNYDARLTIEGSNDQREWFTLREGVRVLAIHESGIDYEQNAFALPEHQFEFVRIGISSPKKLTLTHADLQYLLRKEGTVHEIPLKWEVKEDKKAQRTVVDITLQYAVPVSEVSFSVNHDLDFYRTFNLEAVLDSAKTDDGWKLYYTDAAYGYLTSVDSNAFSIELVRAKKWRMIIHNQDNEPLRIASVRAVFPQAELVCRLSPGTYTLLYGNDHLRAPNYDIVHFKENVPAKLATVSPGDEQHVDEIAAPSRALFNSKWWLWVILVAVVGTMGFFTLKMMHGKKAGEVD